MNFPRHASMIRDCHLTILLLAAVVFAGCAGGDFDETSPSDDTPLESSSAALCAEPPCGSPRCTGTRPRATACNVVECVDSTWETYAKPAGTACTLSSGPGRCDGGPNGATGSCEPPPACAAGQTRCGSTCVDLSTNAAHCGACGATCPSGGSCEAGSCFPTQEVCSACQNGSQTCCHYASADVRLCGVSSCVAPLPACAASAICASPEQGALCDCPSGASCGRRCGPQTCSVNWTLCAFFPPLGCLPQCSPGLCTVDSFCL